MLAQGGESGFAAADKELQQLKLVAALLSVVIFFIVLWTLGRRRMEQSDKLDVDWKREEERMRKLAELTVKARSPEQQRKAKAAQPVDRANAGVVVAALSRDESSAAAASRTASPTGGAPADSELGRIIGGLSD